MNSEMNVNVILPGRFKLLRVHSEISLADRREPAVLRAARLVGEELVDGRHVQSCAFEKRSRGITILVTPEVTIRSFGFS